MSDNTPAGATSASEVITPEAIEMMAEHLLEEEHSGIGWTWPTHDGDDGYRGGGYVVIAPPDIRSELREKARRVLIRSKQINKRAALASQPPAVVPESVRKLSEAATQGEWYAASGTDIRARPAISAPIGMMNPTGNGNGLNDRAFIVAAVNFVRTLLADAPPSVRAEEGGEAQSPFISGYRDERYRTGPRPKGVACEPAPAPLASAGDVEALFSAIDRMGQYAPTKAVNELQRAAEKALAAAPEPTAGGAVPAGWKLVPERATPEMIHVMRYGAHSAKLIAIGQKPEVGETPWPRFGEPLAQEAYQAALDKAPPPPATRADAKESKS